jgi:hypothetical protein
VEGMIQNKAARRVWEKTRLGADLLVDLRDAAETLPKLCVRASSGGGIGVKTPFLVIAPCRHESVPSECMIVDAIPDLARQSE